MPNRQLVHGEEISVVCLSTCFVKKENQLTSTLVLVLGLAKREHVS